MCGSNEGSELVLVPRPQGYGPALNKAWEELIQISDEGLIRRKGAVVEPGSGLISITLLGDKYRLDKKKREIYLKDSPAPQFISVLVLHYLTNLSGISPENEWVSFRQFEGGDFYFPAFAARTIEKLKKIFGGQEGKLEKAAQKLNGEKIPFGTTAYKFPVFPKLVIAVVLHNACEEFGSDANILFDNSCLKLLPTEDAAVAASLLVSKLCKGV
ncbi:MAG: DUF3786 domain-containing protein [Planctomycetota bacterium]